VLSNLIHGHAALRGQILYRKAAFRVLPEVLARRRSSTAVCVRQFFGVGFDYRFQQTNKGRDLCLRQLVDQAVSLLAWVGHRPRSLVWHIGRGRPERLSLDPGRRPGGLPHSYHTWQAFSLTMGWPAWQEKAF